MVAPHSGSLGPIAEMAAVHLMCTLPNFLILEHLDGDVPQRYTVMKGTPEVTGAKPPRGITSPAPSSVRWLRVTVAE